MPRLSRQSQRAQQKAKRRTARKRARQSNRNGKRAGSIAIHSRLPGIEGTEIGSMGVMVDARRDQDHPTEIAVTVSPVGDADTRLWIIETGFGGQPPRVGYQTVPTARPGEVSPITWLCEPPDSTGIDDAQEVTDGDGQEVTDGDGQEVTDGDAVG